MSISFKWKKHSLWNSALHILTGLHADNYHLKKFWVVGVARDMDITSTWPKHFVISHIFTAGTVAPGGTVWGVFTLLMSLSGILGPPFVLISGERLHNWAVQCLPVLENDMEASVAIAAE